MSVQNFTDVQNFIRKDNINTIWDVIIDEEIFKFLTRDIQSNVLKLFNENIKGFFEAERIKQTNLIDMNKKYILLILNYIKKNYPNNMPNKIKIYDNSEAKEAITYEEIQNEKKTQFEMDLMKRQQEFTNAMSLDVPEVPIFKDNFTDEPISEMDKMIKEMTAKRNYDIELINRSYNQGNDNWLKPEETSIKSEKFITPLQKQVKNKEEQRDKSVSWGNNEILEIENQLFLDKQDHEDNIFKKLKRVNTFENISLSINENGGINENSGINEKTFHDRLTSIEDKIEIYSHKIDKIYDIMQLLQNNKI
jgi:hypothetical protein